MDGLYTNRSELSDYVANGFLDCLGNVTDVYLAVAFFTDYEAITGIIEEGCHVRMVVRLGYPTNPEALRKLLSSKNVELRFFSDSSFHSKLFIFGDKTALVGSANLTRAALYSNQEVTVSIDSSDERFSELASLFSSYWNEAEVLTNEVLDKYNSTYVRNKAISNQIEAMNKEVTKEIGHVVFNNIIRRDSDIKKKSKENIFLEHYRKTYQETVTAFEILKGVYEGIGKRKIKDASFPIRLEIDSFFSFVRDRHIKGSQWREEPLGWTLARERLLTNQIHEWLETDWYHFDEKIVHANYPLIKRIFSSPQAIESSNYEEIVDGLTVLHSFHDRLRFFDGGLDAHQSNFMQQNELVKVKESLTYLLFGEGDLVKRMADLIYDNKYKINQFGQANVQELVGWMNNEEIPVINGRTTKVIRYYGFDIRQL